MRGSSILIIMKSTVIILILLYECVVQGNYYTNNQSSSNSHRDLLIYKSSYSNIRREAQELFSLSSVKKKPLGNTPKQRNKSLLPNPFTRSPGVIACNERSKVYCRNLHKADISRYRICCVEKLKDCLN